MQDKNQTISIVGFIAVLIIIIGAFVYFNGGSDNSNVVGGTSTSTNVYSTSTVSVLDNFAKCTATKDLTMYGAVWCSHCSAQKKLFGSAFQYVKYVECPDNIKLCEDRGVLGYPTWIDNSGKKYEGEQSLDTISKITSCVLPK